MVGVEPHLSCQQRIEAGDKPGYGYTRWDGCSARAHRRVRWRNRELLAEGDGSLPAFGSRGCGDQPGGGVRPDAFLRLGQSVARPTGVSAHDRALAGISWISGYPDGDPMPTMVCDGLGGVHAAFGMVCGFYATERTRNGAFVEVRLSEVAAAAAAEQTVMASVADVIPQRKANRSQWGLLQGVFECSSDGASATTWIAISAGQF